MNQLFLLISLADLVSAKKYSTSHDIGKYSLGFNPVNNSFISHKLKTVELPVRFDWRDKVNVPIRNQVMCGSCWAFATVSPIEYLYTYKTGKPIHISEQELVSCNSHGFSCDKGGSWDYDDLIENGIVLDKDFPYDGVDEPCESAIIFNEIKVTRWYNVSNSIDQIKNAIIQFGPVAAGVSVDDKFYRYVDGVYDHNSKKPVNHAIVLVGWDDALHSWILRNSWSESWGSKGYMYIEYNASSVGANAAYVSINILSKKNKYL